MALPTNGLILNLDAHSFTLTDGQAVTSWPDQSPAGNTPTFVDDGHEAVAPVFHTNSTPGGSPAVQFFDGSLVFSSNTMFDASTSAEIFVYLRSLNGDNGDNPGFYQFGGNDWTYYPYTDGNVYDGSFTNTRFQMNVSSPSSWHIYNVSHNGSLRYTNVDGTTIHGYATPFVPPSQADKNIMRIGRTQGVPWKGQIAAFIAYNRALTGTERQQVIDYLTASYINVSSPQTATAPAAELTVDLPLLVNDPLAVIPAAGLSLDLSATEPHDIVAVPAAELQLDLSASASAAALILSSPIDGTTVLTATPTFVVALTAPDSDTVYTVEVQYDDNSAFTSPTTLTGTLTPIDGGVQLTATSAVPITAYWRARLLIGTDEQLGWSNPVSFTVTTSVPTTLPVTWLVDSNAERPIHVWHFSPAGPTAGDTVTLYGQGFPNTGSIAYGDTALVSDTWELIPASDDNTDDQTRLIDADTVTCEHYEITFTAPLDDGTGAALTVEA